MKILVVAHNSNFSGGANRSLYMVLSILKEKYNVEIEVLVPKKYGKLNDKLDELQIPWFSYPYFGAMSGVRNDGKDFIRYAKVYFGYFLEHCLSIFLIKKLKGKKYDFVYTNTRLPVVGAKIAKGLNIPHICHVREFGAEKPIWGFWDDKKIYDMSSKIITISQALYNKFAENVPTDKLITIHNGVDSPLGLEYCRNKNNETYNLILTGRLVPDKGHKDAIEAIEILKEKGYSNIKLFIVGSSPKQNHIEWYADELKKMIKDKKLEENIEFCGEVEDMVSLRYKMDVELICSICETFGRVTVEAMRSGLLVIGSNTGGTPEIINDGVNGLLYEQGNSRSLAQNIEKAYLNIEYSNKLRDYAYKFSQYAFTPSKNVKEIYDVLISRKI